MLRGEAEEEEEEDDEEEAVRAGAQNDEWAAASSTTTDPLTCSRKRAMSALVGGPGAYMPHMSCPTKLTGRGGRVIGSKLCVPRGRGAGIIFPSGSEKGKDILRYCSSVTKITVCSYIYKKNKHYEYCANPPAFNRKKADRSMR
jgi:hypothetical protein